MRQEKLQGARKSQVPDIVAGFLGDGAAQVTVTLEDGKDTYTIVAEFP